jgi:AcrR family transcriptional regulator
MEDRMPTPDRTSLDAIVTAGRDLLEAGGPDAVTMQAVANRVGVRAPSLYKRVADRPSLLSLVADATALDLATRLERVEGIGALARGFRSFARERPEGFRLAFSGSGSVEVLARASAPVLGAAEDLVGAAEALPAARLLTAWLVGFVSMELAGAFQLGGSVEAAFEFGLDRLEAALSTR